MTDFDVAVASLQDYYARIYWQASDARTENGPDFTLTYSGMTWQHSINHLWLHRLDILTDDLIARTRAFFGQFQAEYSIVFNSPIHPEIAAWLLSRSFIQRVNSPFYLLRGLPRPQNANRNVVIKSVGIEEQPALLDLLYGTFFIGPDVGRSMVRPEHASDPSIRHYLAYLNGEPAGCGTILLKNKVAGVWNIATQRSYRRMGIASALMMQALVEAASAGYPDSVLAASPMGRPLYEEMGYKCVGATYFYGPLEAVKN